MAQASKKEEDLKSFKYYIERAAYSKGIRDTFDNYLDMCVCVASIQQYEDEYKELASRYKAGEMEDLVRAFSAMIIETEQTGDCLGEWYMEYMSHGGNGEFYTPMHLCEMMCKINAGDGAQYFKKICDPACGSGRMLVAMGKEIGMHNMFYGFDTSWYAVRMCALNMWMHGLPGYIVHGNSLSLEAWNGLQVQWTFKEKLMAPQITKLTIEQCRHIVGYIDPKFQEKKNGKPVNVSDGSNFKKVKVSETEQLTIF